VRVPPDITRFQIVVVLVPSEVTQRLENFVDGRFRLNALPRIIVARISGWSGYRGALSPGVERSGREADHSPLQLFLRLRKC
jgi:hypothetical protein